MGPCAPGQPEHRPTHQARVRAVWCPYPQATQVRRRVAAAGGEAVWRCQLCPDPGLKKSSGGVAGEGIPATAGAVSRGVVMQVRTDCQTMRAFHRPLLPAAAAGRAMKSQGMNVWTANTYIGQEAPDRTFFGLQKTTVSSMVPRVWMILEDMTASMSCSRCFFGSSLPT